MQHLLDEPGQGRAYTAVLRYVEDALATGDLKIGDKLPGERELSDKIGVARSSVREAIKVLEAMGMLASGVGSGARAGNVLVANPAAPLGQAMRWHHVSGHLPASELVTARILVETWACETAAANPHRDTSSLRNLLTLMDSPDMSIVEFLDADSNFHAEIANIAGNGVITMMMQSLRTGIAAYTTAGAKRLSPGRWQSLRQRLTQEHVAIERAIAEGNGPLAAELVSSHVHSYVGEVRF